MKKSLQIIILTILLCFPIGVCAKDGISNYYIDLTVEKNGDVTVEELFVLEGSYNGYGRIINYAGAYSTFDGSLESFNGSRIYNGDSVEIKEVKSIAVASNSTFSDLKKEGKLFEKSSYASTGEYGKYTVKSTENGKSVRIYNPSSQKQKGFYIKYVITNMAVVHNDIAEIGFNLFSDEQLENIDSLEMHIHIPGNETELRAWGHGPLWGETKNLSKEEIQLNIESLDANQAVDIRFVFDKSVVPYSIKRSGVAGLSSILTVEAKKADEANEIREQKRMEENRKQMIANFFLGCGIIWLIGLILLIFYVYHKYDKEYKNVLPSKYYREFPDTYGPEVVGYLFHKKITNDDLSASILNLIYKKAISFEPLEKKDYKLTNLHPTDASDAEQKLLDWLFYEKEEITLSELKKEAKSSYDEFLKRYNAWKVNATKVGESHQFYENSTKSRVLSILYCVLGMLLSIILLFAVNKIIIGVALYLVSFCTIFYFATYKKRSKTGSEAYYKWLGLKNFMNDFGNFEEKELPEITLWEKYLVYAVSLGCAKKLSKTMEIKVKELENTGQTIDTTLFDLSRMHMWLSFNQSLSGTVTSAISTAHSTQIENSSSSSSGGFGGGFSGGGGSFGGGGGGGRF